jgi:hypothetical protein
MPDFAHFQQLVQEAIQQALNDARAELTTRVMQAIAPALAPPDDTERLAAAIRTIEAAFAQTDILGALLHTCSGFASRCALFVVRGVSAPMWQSSGFGDGTGIKGISAQIATGVAATAMHTLAPVQGSAVEFDGRFIAAAGAPADGSCVVLPLIVREKVAALVYADAGSDGKCDSHALEILVRAAGNRIEIAANRKAPAAQPATAPAVAAAVTCNHAAPSVTAAPTPHAVPAAPFAGHTLAAGTASAPAMAPEPAVSPNHAVQNQPATHVEAAASNHQAPSAPATDELQVKARRFAKLLVDEIKLYNQQAVTTGKQAGDLYDRLREPIDKSREAYERRYANTAAAAGNHFMHELVRILADNNIALMGANFPR